jgi:hypothetical protein
MYFCCTTRDISHFFHHADRGTSHLAEMSALGRHGDAQATTKVDVGVGGLQELERNLHGLTYGRSFNEDTRCALTCLETYSWST